MLVAMSDVTRILSQIEQGDPRAAEQLLPLVYDQLRRLAEAKLAHEKPGQTLQATALVHEAYLRLVAPTQREGEAVAAGPHEPRAEPPAWHSRRHFFAAAAESMQRILIESARRKKRLKRGGALERAELGDVPEIEQAPLDELIDLGQALTKLARENPQKAELVKLRFFAGLSLEEIGQLLGISLPTVKRHWRFARAWLHKEMHQTADSGSSV
jgi:RNA polymerase sigma factor (sigma-70 family)